MKDLIVIAGAPGSGKTTVAELLKGDLKGPYIDFARLRELHLHDPEWSRATEEEEAMAFESLEFMLRNYLKHGYKNIIVTDLKDFRVGEIPQLFRDHDFLIVTLIIEDEDELRQRIAERKSGFRDVQRAIEWNRSLKARPMLKNEHRIDNTHHDPRRTAEEILRLVKVSNYLSRI